MHGFPTQPCIPDTFCSPDIFSCILIRGYMLLQTSTRPPRRRSKTSSCHTTAACWSPTPAVANPRSSVVPEQERVSRSLTDERKLHFKESRKRHCCPLRRGVTRLRIPFTKSVRMNDCCKPISFLRLAPRGHAFFSSLSIFFQYFCFSNYQAPQLPTI